MISCNCQFVVRVCCYFLVIFCLISPSFHMSKGLSLLHKFCACSAVGGLLYLIQYYIRAKVVFFYSGKSILFIVLDLLDFSIPAISVLAAIFYAAFLKQKTFLRLYNKFVESDTFLGERYSNLKKASLLLLVEFLCLSLLYIFNLYVLNYLVHQIYGIYYDVPRENICYCLTTAFFLLSSCSVRVFIVLIRMTISGTNKKLTHSIEGVLSFASYKQLPHFMPYFEIYPYLVQYKACFELIRYFNNYFGFQLLMISCASFHILIYNMYLSTLQLKGTALEIIPPYIILFRHIFNSSMYLVRVVFCLFQSVDFTSHLLILDTSLAHKWQQSQCSRRSTKSPGSTGKI